MLTPTVMDRKEHKSRPWRRPSRTPALSRSRDDAGAFAEFYATYVERVVVFFARRTLDVELASDLAAETFALAWERRRQFRGASTEEEQGWLFAIARSQLSHFWRRGQVEQKALDRLGLDPPVTDSAEELDQIEELAGLSQLRADILNALSHLSEDQAYVVRQRVLLERSYAELADELSVSEQVVRARLSRGLRAMAATLIETTTIKDVA